MIRKIRLISKRTTSQPEKQEIAIHMLPNISNTIGNQRIKFGQLAEYNTKKFFLKNDTQDVVERNYSQTLFQKYQN